MESSKNKDKSTSSALSVVLLILIFGGFFYLSYGNTPSHELTDKQASSNATNTNQSIPDIVTTTFSVSSEDAVYGSRDADIFIIEYSDFECPYCKRFHTTAESIVDESQGKIAWVYRHNAIPSHRNAEAAAIISECVRSHQGNDIFWEFATDLFDNQSSISNNYLKTLASGYGVSSSQISECLRNGSKEKNIIALHKKQARKFNFNGTPNGIIINKVNEEFESLPGALPKAELQKIIDSIK